MWACRRCVDGVILFMMEKPIGRPCQSTSICSCRNLQAGESKLKENEEALLDSICKAYYLPKWCSINDYEKLFQANGLEGIKTADWSEEVAPFWGAVIKSALSAQGFMGLFKAGITTIKVWVAVCCTHNQVSVSCKPMIVRVDALKGNMSATAPCSIAVIALQQFRNAASCRNVLRSMLAPSFVLCNCPLFWSWFVVLTPLMCCSGRVGNATDVQRVQQGSCQV